MADPVIHVVDDDPGVRRTLARLLETAGFAVRTYESGMVFIQASAALSEGCVLVDVRMPGMDGLELQARLKDEHFDLPIIMITGRGDVLTAVRAMKGGAVDFLEKPFSDDLLLKTIERTLAARDRDQHRKEIIDAAARIAALSPRESEVLDAVLAGRPNKAIAFELGLSVRTVEVHRARMMDRLGVRQVAEAVRLAVLARMAS
jgi:two-component system, LuxR family, response regulator FixJ